MNNPIIPVSAPSRSDTNTVPGSSSINQRAVRAIAAGSAAFPR
jgi:hypothetical protein